MNAARSSRFEGVALGPERERQAANRERKMLRTRWIRLCGVLITAMACAAADRGTPDQTTNWDVERARMVTEQLRARDIRDPRVLDAMSRVPRHLFVPEASRALAYGDFPLPIGFEQTISQPYIVAFMTQALRLESNQSVLEIGTGSGYQAAILAELSREVYTIEIIEPLADSARRTLASLGYKNVHVRAGDGYLGWPEHAPFDRVMVTAAPEDVPQTLVDQLRVDGLMAIPVGRYDQELRILRKTPTGLETLTTLPVRFVPMVKGDR
jgi:protein-L-isoaspartate(D-aspartate) O-methyltransferase